VDDNVHKELETLKGMVLNWKRGFLGWASSEGDNEYVIHEFSDEIQQQVYPYVRRMCETGYLTESEAKEFMNFCYSQVEDLRRQLEEMETSHGENEVRA
jgi:outer membrane protease